MAFASEVLFAGWYPVCGIRMLTGARAAAVWRVPRLSVSDLLLRESEVEEPTLPGSAGMIAGLTAVQDAAEVGMFLRPTVTISFKLNRVTSGTCI